MQTNIGIILSIFFIYSSCTSTQVGERNLSSAGLDGADGANGAEGENGTGGSVTIQGLKCVVSTNLKHLRICLSEGKSVNKIIHTGETIFQIAIKSRDLPMLQAIIDNPDETNKPDLRVRYTNIDPAYPGLNIYEFILYRRALKQEGFKPMQLDTDKLKNRLYVDNDQNAQLKVILSIEKDKLALENETRQILINLKASAYNSLPSVQEAISLIETALEN